MTKGEMGKVIADISMSLDGFITGPDVSVKNPLGDEGERLHDWIFGTRSDRHSDAPENSANDAINAEVINELFRTTGTVIMGEGMFELGEGPWGNNPPFHMPVFVITHKSREKLEKHGGTTFTFVNDGIESALEQAKAKTGDKNVGVWGGANIIQQFINAGLLDELKIHLVPILLYEGIRLFDHINKQIQLKQKRVIEATGVTHIKFEL